MMKKIFTVLFVLLVLSMFFSCDTEDGTLSPDGGAQSENTFTVQFSSPGVGTLFTAKGKIVDGTESIDLNGQTVIKNDDYWDGHDCPYLGLFTEPNGGTMCYDAQGVYVGDGTRSLNGVYYARFDGERIPISYGEIEDPAAYGLPTSVKYGEPLGITSLPVLEKEGYEFIRWELPRAWGLEVTNKSGEMLGNYLIARDDYYSSTLTSKSGIYFYPVYEKILPESDVKLTLNYNDGTQRVTYKDWYSGAKFTASSFTLNNGVNKIMKGWSLTPDGKEPFRGYITEDTTLYAIWAERRYISVTTVVGEETLYEVTEGETTVLPTPTRDGYIFTGWYTNELRTGLPVSGEVEYSHPYEFYYAGWQLASDA